MVSEEESGMTSEGMQEEPTTMEETSTPEPMETTPAAKPKAKKTSGRRAALRIVREEVDSLGKEIASFRKGQDAASKKLEKQIAGLHSEVAALKSHIAKEGAHARAKQDALLSKILAKLNTPKAKAAPKKKKKSKGKK